MSGPKRTTSVLSARRARRASDRAVSGRGRPVGRRSLAGRFPSACGAVRPVGLVLGWWRTDSRMSRPACRAGREVGLRPASSLSFAPAHPRLRERRDGAAIRSGATIGNAIPTPCPVPLPHTSSAMPPSPRRLGANVRLQAKARSPPCQQPPPFLLPPLQGRSSRREYPSHEPDGRHASTARWGVLGEQIWRRGRLWTALIVGVPAGLLFGLLQLGSSVRLERALLAGLGFGAMFGAAMSILIWSRWKAGEDGPLRFVSEDLERWIDDARAAWHPGRSTVPTRVPAAVGRG